MTTSEAEFIPSIFETEGPSHLVMDGMMICEGAVVEPTTTTIYERQFTIETSGASPLVNQTVITSGIVTGSKAGYGYFIQDGTGPWNGLFVNDATNNPALGDELEITGTVQESFAFTRLSPVTGYTVLSTGNTVPAAENLAPTAAASEQWESVLVSLADMECLSTPNQYGEWNISNWQGALLADDELYAATPTVGNFYSITGPMFYAFNLWRILPRSASDLSAGTGMGNVDGATFSTYPNPANDVLTIELSGNSGRTEVSPTDASGRVVLNDVTTTDRAVVNTSAYANGVHMLTVRTNNAMRSQRIAIQH